MHLDFPDHLPVCQVKDQIMALIERHPIIIIAGETGSGKSTQLPKMCLALGRGRKLKIAHTQPRRLAARSTASRLADELKVNLGFEVGYKIRFAQKAQPDTRLLVMTDGLLLAEAQSDPYFSQYDTLIIDEAHERSLNIDLLLGLLKRLSLHRADLKIIITSATIEPERYATYFNDAPILQVSGRSYPVETWYRPSVESEALQAGTALIGAVRELQSVGPGDILVFLASEREIRLQQAILQREFGLFYDICPLYSRLPFPEQQKLFKTQSQSRIILATNVAETSLTLPSIRYVIDTGLARISRYSYRTQTQRLPIEPISQASANQRRGRCGRIQAGICIRLYAEDDLNTRPQFNEPEILRTHLSQVILQMLALKINDIEQFPFLDSPDARLVRDGVQILMRLKAIDAERRLTPLGLQLLSLPLEPWLGVMLLMAAKAGALSEVIQIVAGLSLPDARLVPSLAREQARQAHQKYQHPKSDFMSFLSVLADWRSQKTTLSRRQLKAWCTDNYLLLPNLQTYKELISQLTHRMQRLNFRLNDTPADYNLIHRCLLRGLCLNVGQKTEDKQFVGPKNVKFVPFPNSVAHKNPPPWLMFYERIETRKVYSLINAEISPEMIEEAASDLLKYQYHTPKFDRKQKRVVAFREASLYGLVTTHAKPVDYGAIDPEHARAVFISEALCIEPYREFPFISHNRAERDYSIAKEHRIRRLGMELTHEDFYAFYDQYIPNIFDAQSFERWYAGQPSTCLKVKQDRLDFAHAYPETLELNGLTIELSYLFDHSHEQDGITLKLNLLTLGRVSADRLKWLVPGYLSLKIEALCRGLNKRYRQALQPLDPLIQTLVGAMEFGQGDLFEQLSQAILLHKQVSIPSTEWSEAKLEPYLRFWVQIWDAETLVAEGRDFAALKQALMPELQQASQRQADRLSVDYFTDWPQVFVGLSKHEGLHQEFYQAICNEGEQVSLRYFARAAEARYHHPKGVARLLSLRDSLRYKQSCKHYKKHEAVMLAAPLMSAQVLLDDVILAAFSQCCDLSGVNDSTSFERALSLINAHYANNLSSLMSSSLQCFKLYRSVQAHLVRLKGKLAEPRMSEIEFQIQNLVYPGFIFETPPPWRMRIVAYLRALELRLEKLPFDSLRDQTNAKLILPWVQRFYHKAPSLAGLDLPAAVQYRFALEELRISIFAQPMKTLFPISFKRMAQLWAVLDAEQVSV